MDENQIMLVKFKRGELELFVRVIEFSPIYKGEVRLQVMANNLKRILEATKDEGGNNRS